ncbi:TPA: hypothetical protein HA265_01955 [Candidatus Woesearchaeota archaeon]|nr:hypothetical protein [Candidatus Woesearchaeota archaeon]
MKEGMTEEEILKLLLRKEEIAPLMTVQYIREMIAEGRPISAKLADKVSSIPMVMIEAYMPERLDKPMSKAEGYERLAVLLTERINREYQGQQTATERDVQGVKALREIVREIAENPVRFYMQHMIRPHFETYFREDDGSSEDYNWMPGDIDRVPQFSAPGLEGAIIMGNAEYPEEYAGSSKAPNPKLYIVTEPRSEESRPAERKATGSNGIGEKLGFTPIPRKEAGKDKIYGELNR